MALTLIEASKLMRGDDLRATIIEIFAAQTDILKNIPFVDIQGNALRYNVENTLPGVAFRGINEAYTESVGVINPQTEALTIAGGDLDVDKFLLKTMGQNQRSAQESMKLKALSHNWSNKVIKGDSSTTPREFDGLQKRLTGAQVVSNSAASGGAVLSLANLDQLCDTVDSPTHLIMSKATLRGLTAASRTSTVGGYITYVQDEFGQKVSVYQGLPVLVADRNADVYATLAANEAYTGGGTADGTSIYCVSFGDGMLAGIQNGAPEVTDLGELNTKAVLRTRIEWYAGLAMFHPRAAGRLRDIKAGAVVA